MTNRGEQTREDSCTQRESDLLFPSATGSFRSPSCLDKPFAEAAEAAEIKKSITPRAMRRTHKDLARAAEIDAVVRRSISAHLTDEMDQLYSTVSGKEQKAALTKVVSLAKFREAAQLDKPLKKVRTQPARKKQLGGE